jgi:hypothetical protein
MWKEQLEAERSRLLQRVIALKKGVEWFSGQLRIGDSTETERRRRETVVALDAATRAYEQFCIKELHRDPWPKPVSLKLNAAERAAVARRRQPAQVSHSAPAHRAEPLHFKNVDAYRRYFRAMYPGR